MPLSSDQMQFYEENGYLLVERLFDEVCLTAVRATLTELLKEAEGLAESNARFDIGKGPAPGSHCVRRLKDPHSAHQSLYGPGCDAGVARHRAGAAGWKRAFRSFQAEFQAGQQPGRHRVASGLGLLSPHQRRPLGRRGDAGGLRPGQRPLDGGAGQSPGPGLQSPPRRLSFVGAVDPAEAGAVLGPGRGADGPGGHRHLSIMCAPFTARARTAAPRCGLCCSTAMRPSMPFQFLPRLTWRNSTAVSCAARRRPCPGRWPCRSAFPSRAIPAMIPFSTTRKRCRAGLSGDLPFGSCYTIDRQLQRQVQCGDDSNPLDEVAKVESSSWGGRGPSPGSISPAVRWIPDKCVPHFPG